MAGGNFGFGPMGALPAAATEKPDPSAQKARIDGVASKYQVPANVLMALEEGGGADIEGIAQELSGAVKAGKRIEDIVPAPLMSRAYDIADSMYPRQAAPKAEQPGVLGDMGRQIGGSFVKAAGGGLEAIGIAAEEAVTGGRGLPQGDSPTWARQGARWLADHVRSIGADLQSGVSEEGRAALAESAPDGSLIDPSTWTFGKAPSLRGYAMLGADVLGSLLPVVATAVITKGKAAPAAAVGGGMGAGAGAETAREIVLTAANTKMPDGRSELEVNSPFYRELVASGISPEEAVKRTSDAASRLSALMTAPISAFGGAATAKILTKPAAALASRGLAARVGGTAAISAAEEGVQEVAESLATRAGANEATGMDADITEGTFGDFVMGALGGAVPGAAAGALSSRQSIPESGDDGSVAGESADPIPQSPPGGVVGSAPNPLPDMPPAPGPGPLVPTGPIGRAAASAPDLTPLPAVESPPPVFPDMKPGNPVRLQDDKGQTVDAIFLREEEGNAIVRINGAEIDISPDVFDMAANAARQADEAAATQKGAKGKTGKKIPSPKATVPPAETAPPAPTAGVLSQQAAPAAKPLPTDDPAADLTAISPDEAARRLKIVDDAIKRGGVNKRLKDLRGQLQAAATPAVEPQPTGGITDGQQTAAGDSAPVAELAGAAPQDIDGGGNRVPALAGTAADPNTALAGPSGPDGLAGQDTKPEPVPALTLPPKPRAAAAPMEADPAKRVQPDLLGGAPVTETDMATKERRRKEWGRFLAIAENGKSRDDMDLDGREVLLRPGKVVIRAQRGKPSDLDFTLDTAGMSRNDIAARTRGAMNELDRRSPLPAVPAPVAQQLATPAEAENPPIGADGRPVKYGASSPLTQPNEPDSFGRPTSNFTSAAWKAATNEERAAHSARKGEVQARLPDVWKSAAFKAATAGTELPHRDSPVASAIVGAFSDVAEGRPLTAINAEDGTYAEAYAKFSGGKPPGGSKAAPARAEFEAAAAQANPEPTPAQAEAGNYKKGAIAWNGLNLKIENAKGSTRRKVKPDGTEAWSVVMPAHYGDIAGTKGADGDPVDFYMGDEPKSPFVMVIDQKNADTGAFDEHKVMMGFPGKTRPEFKAAATKAYLEGFSDGKGAQRLGGATLMTTTEFDAWIKSGANTKPVSKAKFAEPKSAAPKQSVAADPYPALLIQPLRGGGPTTQYNTLPNGYRATVNENGTTIYDSKGTGLLASSRQWEGPEIISYAEGRSAQAVDAAKTQGVTENKPSDDLVPVVDVYGDRHRVKKADLDNPGKQMLRRFNAKGDAIEGPPLARGNIDDDGRGVTATWASAPVIGGGRGADEALKTEAAVKRAIMQRGQKSDDFDVRPVQGGFIAVRKDAEKPKTETPAEPAQPSKASADIAEMDRILRKIRESVARLPGEGISPHVVGMARIGEFLIGIGKKNQAKIAPWARTFDIFNNMMAGPERITDVITDVLGAEMAAIAQKAYDDGVAAAEARDAKVAKPAPKPKDAATSAPAAPAYGSANKLVSADRAADLRNRLKAKLRDQLNAGIDPEILAIGAELAVFHIEAGARKFAAFAKAVADDLGTTPAKLRPYLRSWYNGARDMMEDSDVSIEAMDDADTVRAGLADLESLTSQSVPESVTVPPEGEPKGVDDAGPAIRRDGEEPLAETPSQDVQRIEGRGDAGPRGAGGEQGRGATGGGSDGVGDAAARGGRNGAAGNDPDSAIGERPSVASKPRKPRAKPSDKATDRDPVDQTTSDTALVVAAKVNIPAVNFTITDALRLGEGTEGVKYQDNLAAIRTLKQLEAENRRATPQEQAILARYVGWGGLKNAFRVAGAKEGEGIAKGWEKRVAELEELLDPAELKSARNSTKAAHYTSETVVAAIWRGAQRLGFNGGAVLEPSVGVGNFLGLMPSDLRGSSSVLAVEYDGLTAGIAKHLYPASDVIHSGFEKLPLPSNQFALAIGNPPFGRDSLFFQYRPEVNRKTIHNQFFLASLHAVAPDGILAMVVTHNFMDALDPENRKAMARLGDLEASIRLPSNAFEENARTEVVTDILFFRKHPAYNVEAADLAVSLMGPNPEQVLAKSSASVETVREANRLVASFNRWVPSNKIMDPAGSGEEINVNAYFTGRPHRVIGKIGATGTMHARAELNVTMDDPSQFAAQLATAIDGIAERPPIDGIAERTKQNFTLMAEGMRLAARRVEPGSITEAPDGSLKIAVDVEVGGDQKSMLAEINLTDATPINGDYTYRADGKWQIVEDVLDEAGKPVKIRTGEGRLTKRNEKRVKVFESEKDIPDRHRWGAAKIKLLRDMLPIRDLMKRQLVLESQNGTASQIEGNREKLNAAYDVFVATHGQLSGSLASKIALMMPDGALALGAEAVNKDVVEKAAIMSRRVVMPPVAATTARDAADAVAISLGESGKIDIERIATLLKTDVEGAEQALSKGDNPRAFFDPEAGLWVAADSYLSGMVRRKLYAAREAGLSKNVEALERVMPAKWDSTMITPNIGSAWIPTPVYKDFIKHLGYEDALVSYQPLTNSFSVQAKGSPATAWKTSASALEAKDIALRMMNSLPLKVTWKDSDGKTHVDEEATQESQLKGADIFAEFLDWAFQDDSRRDLLVDVFNEKFNTRLISQRDGSHLKMPGKVPDEVIKLRRHQMNAVWRGITDKAVLYDHAVGAGKTYTAIARIMERRRMGLSRKPLVVVPNHLIEQWRNDALRLYPGANVMAASTDDFKGPNRRRLFARIAAGDYDMVIIGHSSFGFIDIDPSTEARYLEEELKAAQSAVADAEEAAAEAGIGGWRKPMSVAEAERLVTKIEERLAKVRATKRDRLLTFEEMGVDDLTIDESHEFKNLAYSSRLQNVSGMGNKTGSAKAMDLHMKARSLHDREGSSLAFLTGTPISNSVAEMYLILRNLAPNELREMGIDNFDAWRSMFVSYASQWEPTESGSVKEVTRLGREWMNMRTLMDLYYSVADAVSLDNIKAVYAEDNPGKSFPVPPVKSQVEGKGDRAMVAVAPDAAQRRILRQIVGGFEGLPGISDPKERNSERLRLMDRARKVSLDARAVDPTIQVERGTGKIGAIVSNALRLYRVKPSGTQIVFLDRSVPKAKGDEKYVADYDEIVARMEKARAEGDTPAEARAVEALEKYDLNDVEARRNAIRGGWNAYDEIKRQLVSSGIPEEEIRFVQEAENDKQKAALFKQVKAGEVRFLIGSTPRMGAGTNVQDRLVALHHADVTWKPSDIEQREGRIVRQGNLFTTPPSELFPNPLYDPAFQVEVIAYATEMTVDAKMWDLNSQKLRAINGIRKYDGSFLMEFEDEESAGMAEMAALATGNPMMVERIKLDGDIKKLDVQRRSFNNRTNGMRALLRTATRTIETADAEIEVLQSYSKALSAGIDGVQERSAARRVKIDGKPFASESEAREAALAAVALQRADDDKARFKVDIDGLPVTTLDGIDKAISAALGTRNFEMVVNGKTITSLSVAANEVSTAIIAAQARQGDMDTVFLDGIEFMGMPMEIDVSQGAFDRGNQRSIDLNMVYRKRTVQYSQYRANEGRPTPQGIRAGLERLLQNLQPANMDYRARNLAKQKDEAIDRKPELEAEAAKVWPKADEYEAKKQRYVEVVASIEKSDSSAQLGSDDVESAEMRGPEDRPVVAELSGDELGAWEDIRQLGKKAEAWYRANLVGTTVTNRASGAEIRFNGRGARKIGGRKGEDIYRGIVALREILADGQIVETLADRKDRDQVKAIHKIAARISVAGRPMDLIATVREMSDGTFHYDLSKEVDGEAKSFSGLTAQDSAQTSALEGGLAELNMDLVAESGKGSPKGWGKVEADDPITDADIARITRDLNTELAASGLEGKVAVRAVRNLVNHATGQNVQGLWYAPGNIDVRAGSQYGEVGVLRHEIIHALRSDGFWNKPFGMFTGPEWREMARVARADDAIRTQVLERYPEAKLAAQAEEMVAELYRLWAEGRDQAGAVARTLERIRGFITALANALRGRGFVSASRTMEAIATGKVGGRGPEGGGGSSAAKFELTGANSLKAPTEASVLARAAQKQILQQRDIFKPDASGPAEMRGGVLKARDKFKGLVGSRHWQNPGEYVSNLLTDAMSGNGQMSALGLVPGRALFAELGKRMISAKTYLRAKEEMDALRNDWHHRADAVSQRWLKLRNTDPRTNDAFMDLMHRSTVAGIDPSRPDDYDNNFLKAAKAEVAREGPSARQWAQDQVEYERIHKKGYATLREMFDAMPPDFQALYRDLRKEYDKMGDDFEAAVLDNIRLATKFGLKRAEKAHRVEMKRITDEGLEGEERETAIADADAILKKVKVRAGFGANARLKLLRQTFESNRLKGPYFPLARFGNYFVTVRDEDGKVVSFSRFEKASQQQAHIKEMEAANPGRVQSGLMADKGSLRAQVDPTYVADIEMMLAEAGASNDVMDAVWQRWLETLPDQSIRTSKIHRKGRAGWNEDAFRAFGKHMFHGAHQLARLKYGLTLEEALNDARDEAGAAKDPNRTMAVVNEMEKRHQFTMNPTGNSIVASMSGLAFIWYLGATPAAALANITQTTVVGTPLMAARFKTAGVSGALGALARAAKDYGKGRGAVTNRVAGVPVWTEDWTAQKSPDITQDEHAAISEAIRRGTIDKTQAHDLAAVAETGIEYNASREKWMRRIGWMFHQAEKFNREVTFLANYRLAREEGLDHEDATDAAADMTWKIHFDYQNTSRPRFMQNDLGKVLTTFRQFTVNTLWRMFRDSHQALNGATKEERAEARAQLIGITLSMMAHAGVKGTWGYGLLMGLLAVFFPGDDDDLEEWMQDALLVEGDGAGAAAWNFAMGAALNGAPGQILGVDLTNRIGMPDLWFRSPDRDLEGRDVYAHYVTQLLGPVYGIGQGFVLGAADYASGEFERGTEAWVPKAIRDLMKTGRYAAEGVMSRNDDVIVESLNPWELLMQANGFTPAAVAERFDMNTRLKNKEGRIMDERRDLHRAAGDAISSGGGIPNGVLEDIRDFNSRYPEYPVTADSIQQSFRSRQGMKARNEFGVALNPKLNTRLRAEQPPAIYN